MTFDSIEQLLAEGTNLHSLVSVVKTHTSKEIVEQEDLKRKQYINELQKAKHELRCEMDKLRAYVRLIDIAEDMQKTDCREITSYMFKLIQELKDTNYGRNHQGT